MNLAIRLRLDENARGELDACAAECLHGLHQWWSQRRGFRIDWYIKESLTPSRLRRLFPEGA